MRTRLLTIFFAALFFIHVVYLLLGFASIPLYYQRVSTLTIEPYGFDGNEMTSNALAQAGAVKRGMTLSQYAVEQIIFNSGFALLFVVVATLIVWRARWHWFAWYTAFLLVFIAGYALADPVYVARLAPREVYDIGSIFWPLILLYFFLFPNGTPVPRKALWFMLPLVVLHFVLQASFVFLLFFPNEAVQSFVEEVVLNRFQIAILLGFGAILGFQVYRYVRISTGLERQQTKWFLFGLVAFVATIPLFALVEETNPFSDEANLLIFAFVPLSVGIAILRYRLFDIDVLIRRTLQYSLLSVLLASVYFGSVTVLQSLYTLVSRQASPLVTVISTLLIAVLFSPLRRRIQDGIDRRFYRRRYDAEKALANFASTARRETDLELLVSGLVETVQDTLQPASISLWVYPKKGASRVADQ